MRPETIRSKGKAGAAIGAVLTGMIFFVVVVVGGIWVKQDREKLITRIERLQTERATANESIEELNTQLTAEQRARADAEETADVVGRAAVEAREELAHQQERLRREMEKLKSDLQEREQQLAAATEARTQAEATLAQATDARSTLEQELVALRERLQQQEALVSELQAPAETEVRPLQDAGERVAATTRPREGRTDAASGDRPGSDEGAEPAAPITAAKQAFDDEEQTEDSSASSRSAAAFDTPPEPLDLVSPEYPRTLRQEGTEGRVVVSFTVNRRGRVENVDVQEASHGEFQTAAVEAVRRWRFKPAMRDGEPVEVRISQRLDFAGDR